MKGYRMLCIVLCLIMQRPVFAQVYDSLALQLLDRMSEILSDVKSCHLVMNSSRVTPDMDYGQLTHFSEHEAYYSGNNKFYVRTEGEKDDAGYWYDGQDLYYYSYSRNQYGHVGITGVTTLHVIDSIHRKFDVDFPGIDFFYPSFTDDLIAVSDRIEFFGITSIGGKECFKIAATGKEQVVEIWLTRDVLTLPYHLIVTNNGDKNSRYEARYTKWELNPDLPEAMFHFKVPPDASKLTIVPKKK